MSNEHKYNMIMILRKLYSLINESNICHLISGQHRQHITNYVILHVFQQQRYMQEKSMQEKLHNQQMQHW